MDVEKASKQKVHVVKETKVKQMGNCFQKPNVSVSLPEIRITLGPAGTAPDTTVVSSVVSTNNKDVGKAKNNQSDKIDLETLVPAPAPAPIQSDETTFQHILEGIYDAAVKAHANVQMNNLHQMFLLFPQNEDGVHVPKSIKVEMPCDDGGGNGCTRIVDVPLFTLLSHKHLSISKLRLETTLDVGMFAPPVVTHAVNEIQNKKYSLKLVPGKKQTKLEVEMKIEEPIEVYHRLAEKFERAI